MCQNLQPRLSAMSGISHEVIEIFADLVAIVAIFSYVFTAYAQSVYLGAFGKNSDMAFDSLTPITL